MDGDRIEVRDLRVMGVHGVLPEERERAQPFALDLDVALDLRRAGATDALEDTADYGALCTRAVDVVASSSFLLLEALADAVARALLEEDERVTAVQVTVRKLRPPIAAQLGSVGVRVVRERATAGTRHAPPAPGTRQAPPPPGTRQAPLPPG